MRGPANHGPALLGCCVNGNAQVSERPAAGGFIERAQHSATWGASSAVIPSLPHKGRCARFCSDLFAELSLPRWCLARPFHKLYHARHTCQTPRLSQFRVSNAGKPIPPVEPVHLKRRWNTRKEPLTCGVVEASAARRSRQGSGRAPFAKDK